MRESKSKVLQGMQTHSTQTPADALGSAAQR